MKIIVYEHASNLSFAKNPDMDVVRICERGGYCGIRFMPNSEADKKFTEAGFDFSHSGSNEFSKGFGLHGDYKSVVKTLKSILGEDTEVDYCSS